MENENSVSIQSDSTDLWRAESIETRSDPTEIAASETEESCGNGLALLLRDGLDYPIANLEVRVTLPEGTVMEARTDDAGAAVFPAPNVMSDAATLSVLGVDGAMQQVCAIDLAQCTVGAIIRSPKIAAPLQTKTRSHALRQAAQASSLPPSPTSAATPTSAPSIKPVETTCAPLAQQGDWYVVNEALEKAWAWLTGRLHASDKKAPACGANTSAAARPSISGRHVVKESASAAGNPVTVVVGPECPNAENFRLGRNNIYREAIKKAAARCGLMPQAVAALIDAEAAKKAQAFPLIGADGKPMVNKKTGKPRTQIVKEQWDEDSYNAQSRAAGLTQFLESTWLSHAMKPGYYIHEQCVARGWVKSEKDTAGKSSLVFALANGKLSTKPWQHTGDANVQACLKQRFDAEWSIMAAADYGKANLDVLQKRGFNLAGLNDAEKAKLMYLMHHEGEGTGPLFIRNELSKIPKGKFASAEERLRHIFEMQVGMADAEKWEKRTGGVQQGYRSWLSKYINDKFDDLARFACDGSKLPRALPLIELFGKLF